jgi:arylsulfatase A-like enzyme
VAAYDAEIKEIDASIGRLLADLEQRGRLRRTLVIVTSDHGESFAFGAGYPSDHKPASHGTSLYPEQIRVPLILAFPGSRVAAGTEVEQAVSVAQIPATVHRLLGIRRPLFPLESLPLNKEEEDGDAIVQIDLRHLDLAPLAQAVADERWLLIDNVRGHDGLGQGKQLFDLKGDPLARKNLWSTQSENAHVKELTGSLSHFQSQIASRKDASQQTHVVNLPAKR